MMNTRATVKKTLSVCPVCLARIPAEVVKSGQDYYMEKTCPSHGRFSAVVWRGESPSLEDWESGMKPQDEDGAPECPTGCGLCAGHLQKTCCALVEVTYRCNLYCPVCFAGGSDGRKEPSVGQLRRQFEELCREGNTFVQLSGGEPTVRDDLPEIVAAAKEAGCENIQLNTNGIRLSQDERYLKALKEAGLSFVFMQFDGTDDSIYMKLRGCALLDIKRKAIEACERALLGVVLVPTVVPGVNDGNIGEIVNFGLSRSPAVRGVHFQPISYFGRYPSPPKDDDRITLPEILRAIENQTGGKIKVSDFAPSRCDHPRCGFHGDFVVLPNALLRLTPKSAGASCCGEGDRHLKNRNFVARRWKRPDDVHPDRPDADYGDLETFLGRVRSHGFTITAMAFQDAWTLDIARLRRCSLHVSDGGRLKPFCAHYLTPGVAAPEMGLGDGRM